MGEVEGKHEDGEEFYIEAGTVRQVCMRKSLTHYGRPHNDKRPQMVVQW